MISYYVRGIEFISVKSMIATNIFLKDPMPFTHPDDMLALIEGKAVMLYLSL